METNDEKNRIHLQSADNCERLSDVIDHSVKVTEEDDFVLVIDPNDKELVEIPMNSDGTLHLLTLEHAFPGAYGLKYTNPITGARRVVPLDANGLHFCPPSGGWRGKTFSVILRPPSQNQREKARKVDQKAKISIPMTSRKREHAEGEQEIEEGKSVLSGESVSDGEEGRNGEETNEKEAEERERERDRKEKRPRKEWVVAGVPKNCSDLYVVGIPYDLEDEALKEYFEQFGSVELSEIKRDKSGLSRGFAFVRMAQYDDQVKVLSKPVHVIGGRECHTRISSTDKAVDPYVNRSLSANPRVFVGNLESDIGKDRLREFFLEHIRRLDKTADIVDLYYPKPFRNFAFLTLTSSFAAKELVRQRDFIIDGSACEVTVAAPRKRDNEAQFGGPGQLPFGPGTGFIAPGDPRWNIAVITPHQRHPATTSGGTRFYMHNQQQQTHFDGVQTLDSQQQQPIYKTQNDAETSGGSQPASVWSNDGYAKPCPSVQNPDEVRQQNFFIEQHQIPH
ncbi:hypothetical protein niasHS_017597 [Heterodera schachtii]|uniref:RRM domain-containing protein n=1 Tax=Heterodera schachtii TaxID=97005 RepID=A0ABD2I8Z9_HETSC